MAFTVETGAGVAGANAYATAAQVTRISDRSRSGDGKQLEHDNAR